MHEIAHALFERHRRARYASDEEARRAIARGRFYAGSHGSAGPAAQQGRRRSISIGRPDTISNVLTWLDPTTLSAGAVASWTDVIGGGSVTQGTSSKRPTKSSTAISGAYPGVSSDGGDDLVAGLPPGAGESALTLTCALQDSTAVASIPIEASVHSPNTNGGWSIHVNTPGVPTFGGVVRGTSDYTHKSVAVSLATAVVASIGFDFATAGSGALPFIRINGVAQTLTTHRALSSAGVAISTNFCLFARWSTLFPWQGTFGDVVVRRGVAQDSELLRMERWIGARIGLSF